MHAQSKSNVFNEHTYLIKLPGLYQRQHEKATRNSYNASDEEAMSYLNTKSVDPTMDANRVWPASNLERNMFIRHVQMNIELNIAQFTADGS